MDEINETLKENQILAHKFERIEKRLEGISSTENLFEHLLVQIEKEFAIPYVWVSIIKNGPLSGIIGRSKELGCLKDRINSIDEAILVELVGQSLSPVLANTDLHPFYKLLPRNIKYFLKSLAVAPLTVNGAIAGSLNLGDYSPGRYRPGMDTDLLQRLVASVSTLLSAIICRKRSAGANEEAGGADTLR
ncbi:MAG: DUF484 family protein [Deltaproteobacteria bacterium]|nr:DUF484 family protein [Deltaproteobacteria bacterium]